MHVNHPQPKTPYELLEHNVIVAGDTSNGLEGLKFLHKMQNKGHRVFATHGNHEHYSNLSQNRTIDSTRFRFEDVFEPIIDVDDGLTVILANGWYRVENPQSWYDYMNDCRYAASHDPIEGAMLVNASADGDARSIRRAINDRPEKKFIVVTHTAPSEDTLNPHYAGHFSNQWYFNPGLGEIRKEFADRILVWNHGHSHYPLDMVIDGVRTVVNPRGYPRENADWAPKNITVEY